MLSTLVFTEPFNMAPRGSFQTWQPFPICQEQERKVLKKPRSPPFSCRTIIKKTLWSKELAGRHIQEEAVWGPYGSWQLRYRSYLPAVGVASLPTSGLVLLQQPWVMRPLVSHRDEDHILHHCDVFFLCNHLWHRFRFPTTHVQVSLSVSLSLCLSLTHTHSRRNNCLSSSDVQRWMWHCWRFERELPLPQCCRHLNDFQKNQLPFLCQHGFHTSLASYAKTF